MYLILNFGKGVGHRSLPKSGLWNVIMSKNTMSIYRVQITMSIYNSFLLLKS